MRSNRRLALRTLVATAALPALLAFAVAAAAENHGASGTQRARRVARETTREVGHASRDVAKTVGHAARDVTREIGHAFRDLGRKLRD
jgi:hypothetical protein